MLGMLESVACRSRSTCTSTLESVALITVHLDRKLQSLISTVPLRLFLPVRVRIRFSVTYILQSSSLKSVKIYFGEAFGRSTLRTFGQFYFLVVGGGYSKVVPIWLPPM